MDTKAASAARLRRARRAREHVVVAALDLGDRRPAAGHEAGHGEPRAPGQHARQRRALVEQPPRAQRLERHHAAYALGRGPRARGRSTVQP